MFFLFTPEYLENVCVERQDKRDSPSLLYLKYSPPNQTSIIAVSRLTLSECRSLLSQLLQCLISSQSGRRLAHLRTPYVASACRPSDSAIRRVGYFQGGQKFLGHNQIDGLQSLESIGFVVEFLAVIGLAMVMVMVGWGRVSQWSENHISGGKGVCT